MTAKGVGKISRIDGRMDAVRYTTILDDGLLGSIEQQDNDPKHTSKLATDWFKTHSIEI